jgi:tetratricopeptide (TPR) repeat protein
MIQRVFRAVRSSIQHGHCSVLFSPSRRGLRAFTMLVVCSLLACPPSRDDRLAEVRALQVEGRFHETVDSVTRLFMESPEDPDMMRLYGMTMLEIDVPGLAVWPLRALADHPDGGVAERLLLARALRNSGAPHEAFDTLKKVVAVEQNKVEALILHAGLAVEMNHHDAALASSDALLRIDSRRFPIAHVWRAKALTGLDRFDEADQTLEAALEALSVRPDFANWRATLCKISVEVAEAQEDDVKVEDRWETCLAESPVDAEVIAKAIDFFDNKQDRARASAILEHAIEVAPNFVDFRSRLASRLATEGQYDEAESLLLELTRAAENPGLVANAWLAVADYHRGQENYEKAVAATEQGISGLEPIPVILIAQLADDCIQAHLYDRAEELIAAVDRPEYASLLRGRLALAKGDPQKARDELLDGLKLFSGNAAARFLAGQAAAQLGDLDLAIADYRDAVRAGPGDSDAPFALARLYEAQGSIPGAHHILGLRLVRTPEDVRTHKELAILNTKYMEEEDARAAVDKLDKLPGQRGAAVIAMARLDVRHAGPAAGAAAIKEQTEARNMDLALRENEEVLRELVSFLGRSDQSADGLIRARVATTAHPDFAPFHEILAEALTWAEQPTEEIQAAWARALELDPKSARAMAGLGKLAHESDQIDEALKFYDLASAANSDNVNPSWRAIELALRAEREDEVDERLEKLIMKDPIYASAVNLLARRLAEDGSNLDRADELAKRAIRFGESAASFETLGLVSLERGESARALRAFRLALELRPNSPSLRYQLARALIATGNEEAGAMALSKALEGEDFPEADEARAELARLDAEPNNE